MTEIGIRLFTYGDHRLEGGWFYDKTSMFDKIDVLFEYLVVSGLLEYLYAYQVNKTELSSPEALALTVFRRLSVLKSISAGNMVLGRGFL